jgi:hypothetical protein
VVSIVLANRTHANVWCFGIGFLRALRTESCSPKLMSEEQLWQWHPR